MAKINLSYDCTTHSLTTEVVSDEFLDAAEKYCNYYIRISEKKNGDKTIKEFYEKVDLGNQLHRLDYLLLNMRGLCKKITDKHPAYGKLMEAIDLLQHKRNVMR